MALLVSAELTIDTDNQVRWSVISGVRWERLGGPAILSRGTIGEPEPMMSADVQAELALMGLEILSSRLERLAHNVAMTEPLF